MTRNKKQVHNNKGSIYQDHIKLLNEYSSKSRVSKYMKKKLTAMKGKTEKPMISVGYVNSFFFFFAVLGLELRAYTLGYS
jgi:hypothetical protein